MDSFDIVIVGSGINSLVCAAMLTRKGKRVCVLERNAVAGGCIRTEEITLPGFRHDLFSMSYPLFVMAPYYPLLKPDLEAAGVSFVSAKLPTGVVLPDGRALVFSQSREENIAAMNALAPGDGDAYRVAMEEVGRDAPSSLPSSPRSPGAGPRRKPLAPSFTAAVRAASPPSSAMRCPTRAAGSSASSAPISCAPSSPRGSCTPVSAPTTPCRR